MYGETGSPCRQPLPILKNCENIPFCITHSWAWLYSTRIHCISSGPKLKKLSVLYINFQDIESNAFSKSINSKIPGIFFSWVFCSTSYMIRVFSPINLFFKKPFWLLSLFYLQYTLKQFCTRHLTEILDANFLKIL